MKRITISLGEGHYRVVKAYAQSEDISLSKAVVRMMRRGLGDHDLNSADSDDSGSYRDPRTGILVSRGRKPIPENAAQLAEEEADQRKWGAGS